MKNINIPEPCSENWNEMSPTQKGAFCQKCAIDVHDFTNKSGDEIRDILTLNIGSRVCGRIQPKQLENLNDDFTAWQMTNKRSYQRVWVFTLFVVFGMTLFSCEDDEVSVVKELQKTAQTFLTEIPELTKLAESTTIDMGEVIQSEQDLTTGQVHFDYETILAPEPEPFVEILGEMVEYFPEENYPDKQVSVPERNVEHLRVMGGAMVYTERYAESLIEPIVCEAKMSGLVYPNPAVNQTTLKVNLPEKGKTDIVLFGMNGQNIRTIHSGRTPKGESEYLIDLTDLETGLYLIVVYSEGNKETIKFSKI